MSLLLFLHILAIGAWIGCIGVEFVIERSRGGGAENRAKAARLHYYTDLFVEAPIFTTVLITGVLLFDPAKLSFLYGAKVVSGLGAVLTNAYSLYPVIRRQRAAERGDDAAVRHYARLLDRTVPVGVPLALIALAIGLHFLGYF